MMLQYLFALIMMWYLFDIWWNFNYPLPWYYYIS